jgi:hypothetical protein
LLVEGNPFSGSGEFAVFCPADPGGGCAMSLYVELDQVSKVFPVGSSATGDLVAAMKLAMPEQDTQARRWKGRCQ